MTPATLMCTTWPVTDRSPPVDGPCRLVYVVTRPDPLAGAQDLPGTSEVEGMDLAGMAVQRHDGARLEPHQLGPAVRSEAQRAERLARPGRDPWHAVGVQRPGRFECQVAHVSSVECGTATLRPQWPTIQGQSSLVFLGQWAAQVPHDGCVWSGSQCVRGREASRRVGARFGLLIV